MKFKISNTCARLSATIVGSFAAGKAMAQGTDLSSVSSTLSGNISSVGDLVSNGSYLTGAAFVVSGLVHLKNSAENPGQHKAYSGAGKIGIGGALLAAPAIANYAMNSLASGSENQVTGVTGSNTNRFGQ